MNNRMATSDRIARFRIEESERWDDAIKTIPFINFPRGWFVQVIPPFGGAMVRFRVKLPTGVVKSIYLDFYDNLGCYGKPYWEVHPYQGDCGRCDMADTEELIKMIKDRAA